jgi:eukaryotic-like serine/threonine-protein kinase
MNRSTTEGRQLSNRYRIDDFLGQGGMAQVFQGTDLTLDRTVAIKVLSEQLAREPRSVQRFRREAQAAAGLSHPGIVAVYDTGSDGDIHYIVMENIAGQTLADVEHENGPLRPEQAVKIGEAVASALAHAHSKGIVHRDVKPGNIMITPSGAVKVMDFGIARALSAEPLTRTTSIMGTATYLSPEQARGEPVDARSDLYSLGVVLYEMVTGRPPFAADTPVAVAYQHVQEDPQPPSQLNPDLVPGLEAVVLKAMAKDRADRHQTADELADDLRRFRIGGAPTSPAAAAGQATEPMAPEPVERTAVLPPTGPPGRSPGPWRAPWLVPVGILLALALVAGLILSSRSSNPPGALRSTPPSRPSTSPSGTTSNPPPQNPLSVEDAVAALGAILDQGVSSGDVSRRTANEIGKGIKDVLNEYHRGRLDKSLEEVDKLRNTVGDLEGKGKISSGRADQLRQGISELASAMQAAPPSDEDEGD